MGHKEEVPERKKAAQRKKFFRKKFAAYSVRKRTDKKEIPVQISKMMPKTIDTPGSV
ncbi:hypothetical protein [Slackia piriformis]|uniref:hypothetical protein n=1 Tax=Slackia piriformis TaxID=626934 RepID=UPI0032C1B714